MLKAIAAALASLWRGALNVISWGEQLLRWPFSIIFGNSSSGLPNPDYKPDVSSAELLDEFEEARARQAAVHDFDRDGVSAVIKYTKAPAHSRPTIDLGGLGADVRTTLLTMDDRELLALSQAGIGAIRRFVEGKEHGVHGVPIVGTTKQIHVQAPKRMSEAERILWRVRSRTLKTESGQEFSLSR
ncbi:hypothetical protein [Rhizobium grahamii]|uniref:Uncharacterized protein n=1 Tax=Rhizobium grahamii TaxID=1120045 RepID=A0A370KPK2_9HYPH|nr:hypothetical protein [Rhizobium grahamii]RDJ11258.1 hypothetical protein B5K06_13250 [Rhizobium grahamii]